jgi:hypothetical protein
MFIYNSTLSRKNIFIPINKANLDELVVNIEFYKKEHKVYPDSLEVLRKEHEFLMINDPVRGFSKSPYGEKYYYRNLGGKYLLFAMGVDGIPFTDDDIFPSSKYFDSTLTGLVWPEKYK